jgi:hypothetical protein
MYLRPVFLLLLLLPLCTWAAELPGITLYERGEYSRASRALKGEVNNPKRTEAQRARARVYLAAALMALEKTEEARSQLEELARNHPEQRVDPALFPPELVELEKLVRSELQTERLRQEAEQAELQRQAAAEEAARRKREEEAAARNQNPVEVGPRDEVQTSVSAEPGPSSFRLRPEVVGFSDASGLFLPGTRSSFGFGAGLSAGVGMFDGSARLLFGSASPGVELDAGLVFGSGAFQPRVGLRGTFVPGLAGSSAIGGGVSVGGRLALSSRFIALLDASIQGLSVPEGYKSLVTMVSAGVGFNLL